MEKSNGRIPRHIDPARYCISVKGGLRGTQKKMKFKMARYVNYLTTRYAYAMLKVWLGLITETNAYA